MRSLFREGDRTEPSSSAKKKTMKTEPTKNKIRDRLLARPEQLSKDINASEQHKSYSLLPTPSVSEELKITPTGEGWVLGCFVNKATDG
jgi:hypothetical protein